MLFGQRLGRNRHKSIKSVLIVEDEPLIAFDVEHILESAGYVISATVNRFGQAEKMLRERGADLIVADVDLRDDRDGVDVAQLAYDLGVPVLFATGNCPANAKNFAVGCLSKPYSARDLLGSVDVVQAIMSGLTPHNIPNSLKLFPEHMV